MMYWFKQFPDEREIASEEVPSHEEYIKSFTETEPNRLGSLEMVNYKQKIYLITTCLMLNQGVGQLN